MQDFHKKPNILPIFKYFAAMKLLHNLNFMKSNIILFLSGLILLLNSCNRMEFNRLEYYHGNTSLPPPYQESLVIELDSTQGKVTKKKGSTITKALFDITEADLKKLKKLAKKLTPQDKKLSEFAAGGSVSSLALMQGDTTVYQLSWQEQHKISKATRKMEALLNEWAPAMQLDLDDDDNWFGDFAEGITLWDDFMIW